MVHVEPGRKRLWVESEKKPLPAESAEPAR